MQSQLNDGSVSNRHEKWPSLSIPPSELQLETGHVLTTIQDAEMTTHTLSQNVQLHVVKDEYYAEDNFAQKFLFGSG